MDDKILITGGSSLLALNWALSMKDQFEITLGMHDREVSLSGTKKISLDIENIDSLARHLDSLKITSVIHTASLTGVERCELNPKLANHVNVNLSSNVAQACQMTGIKLVHISSDHLFSGKIPLIDEKQKVDPINVYAKTKANAEKQVFEKNPEAIIVRTNFYGWGTSYRQSFSDFIFYSLKSGRDITLFQDVFYSPILIETLAKAVHDLIDKKVNGIFNVVGDDRISKFEFGAKLADQFSLNFDIVNKGYIVNENKLVRRPLDMSLSNHKTCKIIGRKLGGVTDDLKKLQEQDTKDLARELRAL